MKNAQIQIFVTGGTIDNIDVDKKIRTESTYLPELIKQSRLLPPRTSITTLMLKDSREITEKDRADILEKCRNCERDKIIITHGTFTMPETAKYIGERITNKTIILTGSEIPFVEPNSDALFNLGAAIIAAQILSAGVYLTMNGQIFEWNNVRKNLKTHVFERVK